MRGVALETANCIITGKPATHFTGHVRLQTLSATGDADVTIAVLAGFANEARAVRPRADAKGCFGDWKPADGIVVGEGWGCLDDEGEGP